MSCVIVHGNTDTDRGEFIPSQEHIAAECRAIQATWQKGEFATRRGGLRDASIPSRPVAKARKSDSEPDKCNPVPYCCQCFVRLTVSPGYETSIHNHDGKQWCAGCAPSSASPVEKQKRYVSRDQRKYDAKRSMLQHDPHCSNCRRALVVNSALANHAHMIGSRLSCERCVSEVRLAAALAGERVRNGRQILAAHARAVAAGIPMLASGQTAAEGGAR